MDRSRRQLLFSGLFGAGWMGLRALATGLPVGLLLDPKNARADEPTCNATKPQYLIFSTSEDGDPMGNNVPGTYLNDPNIIHPPDPALAATNFSLGDKQVTAAKVWSTLSPSLLARTSFFHHATYSNTHGDAQKVNRLHGIIKKQEMLVSMFGQNIGPCLKTVQNQPVVLGNPAWHNPIISYQGGTLPVLSSNNLRDVLGAPTGPLAKLQEIRDAHVNQMNDLFKQSGTQAQRALLDRYALSQTQVRSLSQDLLGDLATIKDGKSYADRNTAAAVLLKMNVAPVIVLTFGFGGDNHFDTGYKSEIARHIDVFPAIQDLFAKLTKYGLQDSTTLALQNVFGRTFVKYPDGVEGRAHNGQHHCSIFIGAGFRGSVIGGITPTDADYRAQGIDSNSGVGNDAGDIHYEETLGACGKTLAAGLGLNPAVIDDQIMKGKVVRAALA